MFWGGCNTTTPPPPRSAPEEKVAAARTKKAVHTHTHTQRGRLLYPRYLPVAARVIMHTYMYTVHVLHMQHLNST